MVSYLVDLGAQNKKTDSAGNTASKLAERSGRKEQQIAGYAVNSTYSVMRILDVSMILNTNIGSQHPLPSAAQSCLLVKISRI